MKTAPLIAGIMLAVIVAFPAHARKDDGDPRRRPRTEERAGQDGRFMPREFRADRLGGPAPQGEDPRAKRRRLTPEERQELRRDIRDAGRDIYGPGFRQRLRD